MGYFKPHPKKEAESQGQNEGPILGTSDRCSSVPWRVMPWSAMRSPGRSADGNFMWVVSFIQKLEVEILACAML